MQSHEEVLNVRQSGKLSAEVDKCAKRFAKFNECERMEYTGHKL